MASPDAHSNLRRSYAKHRKYVKKANSRKPGESALLVLTRAATKVETDNGRIFDDLVARADKVAQALTTLNRTGDLSATKRRLKEHAKQTGRKSVAWKVQAIRNQRVQPPTPATADDLIVRIVQTSAEFRRVVQSTMHLPARPKRRLRNSALRRLASDLAATNQLYLCHSTDETRADHLRAASYGLVK